jgi:ribonuclease III
LESLCDLLGYRFTNQQILGQALTHKSFRNELPEQSSGDNERLEFLGDAVLDLALSDLLMRRFVSDQEGSLSKKRASLVNEEQLAGIAREIGIDRHLRLGKGERQTGGLSKPRILASALEAVLGAIFVDGGFPNAYAVIERLFEPRLAVFANGGAEFMRDFKTRLQEFAQERHRVTPTYHVEREEGPDHEKIFAISVRLGVTVLAVGTGRSKKIAEQDAARRALEQMTASSQPASELVQQITEQSK